MKTHSTFIFFLFLASCSSEKKADPVAHQKIVEHQIQDLSQRVAEAETSDDLPAFLQHYDQHALSMPEYQPTLEGRSEIEAFYAEIFKRQNIRSYQRQSHEFIHLDSTVVEIGTFKKEFTDSKTDSTIMLRGKYWNVWTAQSDGTFKLRGEAFGYFHQVVDPEALMLRESKEQPDESDVLLKKEIPFELKAYNALMEKGVRNRDGILRSGFFTEDGSFYPSADTTVSGIDKIKPYLIAYSSNGTITIDSIMCYTYAFENAGEYILEYDMFKVRWTNPNGSGKTEGKGMRIWKRQADHSLRLYREIGTHNYLN